MANKLYSNYANLMLGRGVGTLPDLDADNIKAVLYDAADYTLNLATHQDLADIPTAGRVATSGNLTPATGTDGVADFANFVFSSVTGDQSEGIVFYNDTPTAEANKTLIVNFDSATGLPVTPNSANINVNLNASGLFSLVA